MTHLITLDLETYYDQTYSLTKISTEAYVRDAGFETIGFAYKIDNGPTTWVSGDDAHIQSALDALPWEDSLVLAHNTMFDGAILSWRYGVKPKGWLDTMSMGRALHGVDASVSLKAMAERYAVGVKGTEVDDAKGMRRADFSTDSLARYAEYCRNDVELTYAIFQKMMVAGFPKSELKLIDLTLSMFIHPVLRLDTEALTLHLIDTVAQKKAHLVSALGAIGEEELMVKLLVGDTETQVEVRKTLMSNPKFALMLKSLGVEAPTKISPTTGKPTLAFSKTDEAFKELLEHDDVRVQALCAARIGTKSTLEETRTQRFIDISNRGLFPVPLKYYAAHTGRWGGCLVDDTKVTVYNTCNGVETKRIVDVLLDDLVWDGEAFVEHEGVVFSGFSEVIEWDGVTGTEDHVVFTNAGEISLRDAMQGAHRIEVARSPAKDDVEAARVFTRSYQK